MTTISHEQPFRQRFCLSSGCGVMFFVCPHCDRGQRYCGDECRQRSRLEQIRAASRRYQRSSEGRQGHWDRQRSYRQRKAIAATTLTAESVTHQGSQEESGAGNLPLLSLTEALASIRKRRRKPLSKTGLLICQFCEQIGIFLNPFHEFT